MRKEASQGSVRVGPKKARGPLAREILPQTLRGYHDWMTWKGEDEEEGVYGCSSSDPVSVAEIRRAKRGRGLARKRYWEEGWKPDQGLFPVSETIVLVGG